jgi:hypothetical protein
VTKFLISILATILYFIIIVPTSLLLRIFNKKIIPLEFDSTKVSYWVIKKKKLRKK